MSKLIQDNPFCPLSIESTAWRIGFKAGQKSTLAPVSVTGRWWQSSTKKIYFARPIEYDAIQRAIDNNFGLCKWMSEEETRKFE